MVEPRGCRAVINPYVSVNDPHCAFIFQTFLDHGRGVGIDYSNNEPWWLLDAKGVLQPNIPPMPRDILLPAGLRDKIQADLVATTPITTTLAERPLGQDGEQLRPRTMPAIHDPVYRVRKVVLRALQTSLVLVGLLLVVVAVT